MEAKVKRRGRPGTSVGYRPPIVAALFAEADSRNWSDKQYAYMASISPHRLSRIRRGLQDPSLPDIDKLAAAVGYKLSLVNISGYGDTDGSD